MEERILITNIQRFSLHDGPGIRTTVFCKGCSLRCPWCSNPETQNPYPEEYQKDGEKGIYGRYMTCDGICREVLKDRIFYEQREAEGCLADFTGGVTFSGGEPLLQADRMEPLFRRLKERDIPLCAETGLFVSEDRLRLAIKYLNLFYVDIKILDEDLCRRILGGNLKEYFSNLEILFRAQVPVVFRIPVIGGYTDDEKNRKKAAELLKEYRPLKVELLKEHDLGRSKYVSLKMPAPELGAVTDEEMEQYQKELEHFTGLAAEVCRV